MRDLILDKLPHELPNDVKLRILGKYEILGELKIGWRQSLAPSFSSRNKNLTRPAKSYGKVDIKGFWSSLVLFHFFIFFKFIFSTKVADPY